jgi:hypothetical protein
MANVFFNNTKKFTLNGSIDWDSDTIKVALVTSSYTPNLDSHDYFNDVTNEVTGTGYTAGGATLANKAVNQDNTNDRAAFDSDDPAWTTATITARACVLYKSRGGASSADELCGYWDFGSDITSTAGTFTIAVNSLGWWYLG